MTDSDDTVTIELGVTEQQLDDAMRFINKGEIQLREEGRDERQSELTDVWCQLYDGGEAFRDDGDGGDSDDDGREEPARSEPADFGGGESTGVQDLL